MSRVLVVDDNQSVRDAVAQVVQRMGHRADTASGGKMALSAVAAERYELVLTDLRMDDVDGMGVLEGVRASSPESVVVMMTAHGNVSTAVEAMRAGAWDFIEKPFSVDLLREKIQRAIDVHDERVRRERLEDENASMRSQSVMPASDDSLDRIVGSAAPIEALKTLIRKVARTDSTVHIFGESGTGKELVAEAIHSTSRRKDGPFVKVNCGALNDSLLESELFGHEKGAFTDAVRRHIGRFELADGGTLFLDEIGDISQAMQVKLLRALQERAFERVGGDQTITTDVRIVTATNRDLLQDVQSGRFREDLYYRLHIIPLVVPPLRERSGDVEALVEFFVDKLAKRTRTSAMKVSSAALTSLRQYHWPGNVRQLENVIEQALVFAEGSSIELDDLPPAISGLRPATSLQLPDDERPLPEILEDLERQLLVRALDRADGVKTEAARILGIKTPSLYYKLEKYGLTDGSDS
jgi:two-component system response regulator HydG